ncbi:(2Fe-2S)-binding protein [Paenibacillus sp. LHD-38]
MKKFNNPQSVPPASDAPIHIRTTCCLLYQVNADTYCSTCPKVKTNK